MMNKLIIMCAQLNFRVGDIEGNTDLIIETMQRAATQYHADIVVFPELCLTGYPPEDLLFRPYLYKRVSESLEKLKTTTKDTAIIIGYPEQGLNGRYNMAAVIHQGEIIATHQKQCLPNYTVFDEMRYFTPGKTPTVFNYKNTTFGLIICEDLWLPEPIQQAKNAGAKLILSINASPFAQDKAHARRDLLKQQSKRHDIPIIYVNTIGGQDELVFDGGSLVYNHHGDLCQQAAFFEEKLMPVEISIGEKLSIVSTQPIPPEPLDEEKIYQALVLGVRDYVNHNKFPSATIGLSGGIDSALTLAIAIDALGANRVEAVMMPTRYTSDTSLEDAEQLAHLGNCQYSIINIEPIFNEFIKALQAEFKGYPVDSTEENLQARCRGTTLMAISNKKGTIVLTTGNKSETAVGYTTLYGDMAGGFSVLKDVYKTMVYRLARYRNTISPLIPDRIIERPPSAELRPNQLDQDFLPDYAILDEILCRFISKDEDAYTIANAGFDLNTVKKIVRLVSQNEYKRRQSPLGIRITERAFGKDRRYPITSGYFKKYHQL